METNVGLLAMNTSSKSLPVIQSMPFPIEETLQIKKVIPVADAVKKQFNIESIDENMKNRSHLKNSLYTISAIDKLVKSYPTEFTSLEPTKNIGLRLKAELSVRRALNLDTSLSQEAVDLINSNASAAMLNEMEECNNEKQKVAILD